MDLLRTLLLSLVFAVAGGVVLAAATDGFRAFTSESARRLAVREHGLALPETVLQGDAGAPLALADFRGRWLLVDFIYTRCQTYCSVLGGDFARLQQLLAAPIAQGKLHLLSISFDPAHDDPERLRAYKQRFGDHGSGWTAARPSSAAGLAAVARVFGLKVVDDGMGGYVHNAAIGVVDPQGRLVELLDAGVPDQVAGTLRARWAQ